MPGLRVFSDELRLSPANRTLAFTGIRVGQGDWRKYPAHLPLGWTKIEIDRINVKGEPQASGCQRRDASQVELLDRPDNL